MTSGTAYAFRFDGTEWIEEQKFTASDAAEKDQFGVSVSVLGDVIAIGAFSNDEAAPNSGAAYVFRFNGTEWIEEQKLMASDAAARDEHGLSVAVSGDVIVVGAPGNRSYSGSAYIYRFNGTDWSEDHKLAALDGVDRDSLGESLAVSGDVIVVGADGNDEAGENSGAAYVFEI
ncbi:MAG: FG-GAP repeat protein [Deltaproteobacteria bacterium]|nr:FG-GAP repeat protein [Deltaproteobacteria bacterium]